MPLQICLVEDDKVLFSLALPSKNKGELPFTLSEDEVEKLSALYSIGSNRKRFRVMMELAKGNEMRFSEVMQLVTNPKLAQDSLLPMVREGLVLHERGLGYRPSDPGVKVLLVMTLGFGRILALLDAEKGGKPDE